MRLRTALSLVSFFLVCLTLAVWRSPAVVLMNDKEPAIEIQSVSGKIAAVGDAEFTLDLGKINGAWASKPGVSFSYPHS